jgi:predicted dienelactone hydrolase
VRPLEVLLLVASTLAVLRPWSPLRRSRTATILVGVLPSVIAIVQVLVEDGRWQLIPLWIVAGLTLALAVRDAVRASHAPVTDDPAAEPRRISPILLGLVVLASGVLAWGLPIVELPEPDGPFAVGTTTTHVIDEDRAEIYGPVPGGARTISVQIWYPSPDTRNAQPAPWLIGGDRVTSAAARDLGLPWFTLSHLAATSTHARLDAEPLRTGDLQVVLYSHGWSGSRELHVTQLESLASRGYLVIAADHTYGSLATELPDGTIAHLDEDALPEGVDQETYDVAAEQLVRTFAADLSAILDAVMHDGLLDDVIERDRLDGLPVGFVGHSTGGGAAILACSTEPRCGAVVGYDPWVEPVPDKVIGGDLDVPLLSIRSEEWVDTSNDDRLRRLHAGSSGPEGRVSIEGIAHRDMTLLPLLSPFSGVLGLSGPRAGEGTLHDLDLWTVTFLDHHLRGIGSDPLEVPPVHDHTLLEKADDGLSGPG